MKGIKAREKRANDEDNERNYYRLNFNELFILANSKIPWLYRYFDIAVLGNERQFQKRNRSS
jgi:hypothetical protein